MIFMSTPTFNPRHLNSRSSVSLRSSWARSALVAISNLGSWSSSCTRFDVLSFPPCFDQATLWHPVSLAWLVASLVQELLKMLAIACWGEANASIFLPGSCVALFSAACLVPHWFSLKTAFTKKNAHSLVKQLLSVMCSRRTVFASGACAGLDCLSWPLPSSK